MSFILQICILRDLSEMNLRTKDKRGGQVKPFGEGFFFFHTVFLAVGPEQGTFRITARWDVQRQWILLDLGGGFCYSSEFSSYCEGFIVVNRI